MVDRLAMNPTTTIILRGAGVALIAFAVLSWNITQDGIASAYSDPVAQLRAQDEAIYVNSAITMANEGDWLTPKVMGRLFFQKPPLLMWMSALSIKTFGLSLFSVRLPALLLGALTVGAVFIWTTRVSSMSAGILAGTILLMNPLWQTLSRLVYTDVLASGFCTLAMLAVALDLRLKRRTTRIIFGSCAAAAILSKSLAGLLPFGAIGLYWMTCGKDRRPNVLAIGELLLVSLGVVAPWHIYQAIGHPRWFWADAVEQQLFHVGVGGGGEGVFSRTSLFWIERLIQTDPILLGLFLVAALLAWFNRRSHRDEGLSLALCWLLIVVLGLAAFQAKNLPYLTLLLPPLTIFAVGSLSRLLGQRPYTALILVAVVMALRLGGPSAWSWRPVAPPLAGARAMRTYLDMNRSTELIAVDTDDEFYSSTLPLPRVRYLFLDPTDAVARAAPFYAPLGIIVSSEQFLGLDQLIPQYEDRFKRLGAKGEKAIAATITVRSIADLARLLRAKPGSDFYVPTGWLAGLDLAGDTHEQLPYSASRVFLLSRTATIGVSPSTFIPKTW